MLRSGEQRQDFRLGRLHGHDRAPRGQRLHEPPPCHHERARVGQRQRACDVCGGDLADGVPEQVVRLEPPRGHQGEQRDLDGEHRGLGVRGLIQQRRLGCEQQVAQGAVEVGVQFGADLV